MLPILCEHIYNKVMNQPTWLLSYERTPTRVNRICIRNLGYVIVSLKCRKNVRKPHICDIIEAQLAQCQ